MVKIASTGYFLGPRFWCSKLDDLVYSLSEICFLPYKMWGQDLILDFTAYSLWFHVRNVKGICYLLHGNKVSFHLNSLKMKKLYKRL